MRLTLGRWRSRAVGVAPGVESTFLRTCLFLRATTARRPALGLRVALGRLHALTLRAIHGRRPNHGRLRAVGPRTITG
ncbi:hypothetical protein A176_002264 [Myxococcus hansupus]|uniref:Uncharacterized protein n=1 Tax=Pseudomyxococcus hansupus TaxID=1297742 RepID=A0A0H4XBN4_9BACT|nr:hypothetical protein A176_002264 [Myxococcus hansupus]